MDEVDRAEMYLRRVMALTGATRAGGYCILEVGPTRFYVHDKYVTRVRDVTDPGCCPDHTCFYLASQHMPAAERVATALLQLRSNPTLFEGWEARNAVFKPDGQVFEIRQEPPFA